MWTGILAAIIAFFKALPKLIELSESLMARFNEYKNERKLQKANSRKSLKDASIDQSIDRVQNTGTEQQSTPDATD